MPVAQKPSSTPSDASRPDQSQTQDSSILREEEKSEVSGDDVQASFIPVHSADEISSVSSPLVHGFSSEEDLHLILEESDEESITYEPTVECDTDIFQQDPDSETPVDRIPQPSFVSSESASQAPVSAPPRPASPRRSLRRRQPPDRYQAANDVTLAVPVSRV